MLEYLTQTTWVDRFGWVLVHSLWQFALLALVAIVLRRVLQRRSAATRYGALLAAMSMMVVAPAATWFLPWLADAPAAAVRLSPAGSPENESRSQHSGDTMAMRPLDAAPAAEAAVELHAATLRFEPAPAGLTGWWSAVKARVQPWLAEIVLVWLAGVLVAAMRPIVSWHTVRRLRRVGVLPVGGAVQCLLERTAARLRLRTAVDVLQSTLVHAPVVLGYFRPAILLPVCVLTGLPAGQLESILAHELAHIRRHDYLVNLLQTVVETLFFYHPAVWWLSRQVRNERENCCDDVAMAAVGSRADYGRALLAIEELRAAPTALSLAARGGSLLARIRRIAGCEPAPSVVGGGSVMGVVLVSIAIVGAIVWGTATAVEQTAAGPRVESKNASLDPAALVQAYEKTLLPYQRFKAAWTTRFAELKSNNEPKWADMIQEHTLLLDRNRLKSVMKDTGKEAQPQYAWRESVLEKGKNEISISAPNPGFQAGGRPDAPVIMGGLHVSDEEFLRFTDVGVAPNQGVICQLWIPSFLRAAKLSSERGDFGGHPVDVLRGVSGDVEITLWLDPSLGYGPRKVVYDKRSSTLQSPAVWRGYEVKRFEERSGVPVPVEATMIQKLPARPVLMPVIRSEKMVDGKVVREGFPPAKDENGNIIMSPAFTGLWEIRLASIEFGPKFTDEDFKLSKPIPDGTPVSVSDALFTPHVSYEWREGKILKVTAPAIKGKFDPTADAKAKIAGKLKLAKRVNDHVLVIFGANAWPRCAALEEAFQSSPETLLQLLDPQIIYAYQVVMADLTNPAVQALAAEYGATPGDRQSPWMTVLDPDGRVLCNQDLTAFEQEGRYDADKLVAFLKKWEAPRENAEDVVRAALERAAKEQKNAFVIVTGVYCGPCHLLTDFLDRWQEVLGQDYIFVKINMDRMMRANEAQTRIGYPSDEMAGIPWFAILSPKGEKLINSTGPKGNIGYPSEPKEIEHFMKMLRQTSSHISPQQMKVIEEDLVAAGANQRHTARTAQPAVTAGTAVRDAAPAAEKPEQARTATESASTAETESEKSPAASAPAAQEAKRQDPTVRTLPVHVVDVDGKPIQGAKVHSNAVAAAVGTARREIINRNYVTDADGRAAVELPKTVDLLRIWARKDGLVPMFAHWEQQWFAAGRPVPDEVTITLKKGTTIGGFVKNEEGQPIAAHELA